MKNGLVPVVVRQETHDRLLASPGAEVLIDVERAMVGLPDGSEVSFPIDGFARYCLVEGIDQLGFLQQQLDEISNYEEQRPWKP